MKIGTTVIIRTFGVCEFTVEWIAKEYLIGDAAEREHVCRAARTEPALHPIRHRRGREYARTDMH